MKENGLIFLTINEENGDRNPRSAMVVEALQRHILKVEALWKRGYTAVVLGSRANYVQPNETLVVALFDANRNVKRFRPMPKTDKDVPEWAWELSTASCVAIGKKGVAFPSHVQSAAEQIAVMFSWKKNGNGGNGNKYPWGPAAAPGTRQKKHRKREKRSLRTRPYTDYNSHR